MVFKRTFEIQELTRIARLNVCDKKSSYFLKLEKQQVSCWISNSKVIKISGEL